LAKANHPSSRRGKQILFSMSTGVRFPILLRDAV
jgi:hypothetical protein